MNASWGLLQSPYSKGATIVIAFETIIGVVVAVWIVVFGKEAQFLVFMLHEGKAVHALQCTNRSYPQPGLESDQPRKLKRDGGLHVCRC